MASKEGVKARRRNSANTIQKPTYFHKGGISNFDIMSLKSAECRNRLITVPYNEDDRILQRSER